MVEPHRPPAAPAATPARAFIDGGSRGNPGDAACGFVLELADGRHEEHGVFLGRQTNNVAEYAGLLAALERALELGVVALEVRADSELLVCQINGVYRVRAGHLQPLWRRAQELISNFHPFAITHVMRAGNAAADRMANLAMDGRSSTRPRPQGIE